MTMTTPFSLRTIKAFKKGAYQVKKKKVCIGNFSSVSTKNLCVSDRHASMGRTLGVYSFTISIRRYRLLLCQCILTGTQHNDPFVAMYRQRVASGGALCVRPRCGLYSGVANMLTPESSFADSGG